MFHSFLIFLEKLDSFHDLVLAESYHPDDQFVIAGLRLILVEIVVYLLAEETDVDLYYFARLNDSKPDFPLPATYLSKSLCGTYFDGSHMACVYIFGL